jgi:ankyrin repeat protein
MSIFIAIKSNDLVRLNTLINAENINTPDTVSGLTPLMYASKFGKKEIVNLLLTRNANINAQDTYGLTSLMLAVMINNKDIVASLLDKGADVNVTAKNGSNAISIAISIASKNGFTEIVELLKSKGAIVPDFEQKTMKYIMKKRLLEIQETNEKKLKELERLELEEQNALVAQREFDRKFRLYDPNIEESHKKLLEKYNITESNFNNPDFEKKENARFGNI